MAKRLSTITQFLPEEGGAKRFWNSSRAGVPLWLTAATFTAYWHFHLPPPGYAIGGLAVVAGIMSVREVKILGKIVWVVLLVLMLMIEFRAISKDRADNDEKQRQFFDAQKKGFEEISTQAGKNFDKTAQGLQKAIDGLNATLSVSSQTMKQTHPTADVRVVSLAWENLPPRGSTFPQIGTPYYIDLHSGNSGTDDAQLIKRFAGVYVGKPDNEEEQRRIKKIFDEDWKKAPSGDGSLDRGEYPFWTVTKTFTSDESKQIENGDTIYFWVRIEYQDSLGRWGVDFCQDVQTLGQGLDLNVGHPCAAVKKSRYRLPQ